MAKGNRRVKPADAADDNLSSSSSSLSSMVTSTDAEEQRTQKHCEEIVRCLEQENDVHKKEVEDLKTNLDTVSVNPGDGMQKLKEDYLQKLNVLEEQVKELKKKQDAQSQLSTYRRKNDEGETGN